MRAATFADFRRIFGVTWQSYQVPAQRASESETHSWNGSMNLLHKLEHARGDEMALDLARLSDAASTPLTVGSNSSTNDVTGFIMIYAYGHPVAARSRRLDSCTAPRQTPALLFVPFIIILLFSSSYRLSTSTVPPTWPSFQQQLQTSPRPEQVLQSIPAPHSQPCRQMVALSLLALIA
ncbi:hypothetical protein BDZ97DRAFT_1922461 [Flammula alnicola]|nr:hypothetical protein BDZ97DRAFT_1922461 [Flammula alnicola]